MVWSFVSMIRLVCCRPQRMFRLVRWRYQRMLRLAPKFAPFVPWQCLLALKRRCQNL
jgi:hypothetical protein